MGDVEDLVLRLAGTTKANNQLLSVLIASHPQPELLRAMWHASKPEWIDEMSERPSFQASTPYRQGLLERLKSLSIEIDAL